jgi:hypothetical protein
MLEKIQPDSPEFRGMMAPNVDLQIRSAIQTCWMALPGSRRNVDEVEKEIRRVVDRALRDLRDDASSFGLPTS